MDITSREIISRIIYFRDLKNLSARELSLMIGKNATYINHLESRGFNLTLTVLLEILEALDVSCEEFFADNYVTYKTDKELANTFENLTTEKKQIILDLMKNLK